MNRIAIAALTSEAFAPFGEVGAPHADGGHAAGDVALDLSRGTPRFCITRLAYRGLVFEVVPRPDRVTQCLDAVDGEPWLMAVVPANLVQPGLADIRAFCIPPGCCIKLRLGTPQAGPYFTGPVSDFYNLEMVDTNIADYTVWRPHAPLEFAT
jgi:ureidoglycolate hydrolase